MTSIKLKVRTTEKKVVLKTTPLSVFKAIFTVNGSGIIETIPNDTSAVDKGTIITYKATPNSGNAFVNTVIDGIVNSSSFGYFIINKNINGVVNFVSGIILNILRPIGYGTVNPDIGSHSKILDEVVTITATPQDTGFNKTDSYFEKYIVNSVDVLTNPLALTMNEAKNVQPVFKLWNNDNILFNSVPVNRNGTLYFENTGNGEDSEVKSVRFGLLTTTSYINTGAYITGGNQVKFTIICKTALSMGVRRLFRAGATNAADKGIRLDLNGSQIDLSVSNGTSVQNQTLALIPHTGDFNIITLDWNGKIGGAFNLVINGIPVATANAIYEWVGNHALPVKLGESVSSFNGNIVYAKLDSKFEYAVNHGQGSIIYDISGNGNNGTVIGANLLTFWGSTANNIEPYDLTLGATLYQNDSDQTIMPICFNTSQAISGFTRLGWFPSGSGILKGLPNTYTVNGVDRDFAYLKALPTSEYRIKTETANNISYFKERSKDV